MKRHGRKQFGEPLNGIVLGEGMYLFTQVPGLPGLPMDDEGILVGLDTEHDCGDAIFLGAGTGVIDAVPQVFSRLLSGIPVIAKAFAAEMLVAFREVVGGKDEAIIRPTSSVTDPFEEDGLKIGPSKLKVPPRGS